MTIHEDLGYYKSENGCPHDCDEFMVECGVCGAEFCRRCFPQTTICEECAKCDEEADPDFEDVPSLKELMAEDEDVKRIFRDDTAADVTGDPGRKNK